MKKILLYIFLACCATMSAKTVYCAPNANGAGTFDDPCSFAVGLKTISAPGDTLYLFGGQYDFDKTVSIDLNGSKEQNIVIAGYPGDTAIMDFRKEAYGQRGVKVTSLASYVHLKNLTIRYSGKNNILCNANYCTFETIDAYGSSDTGIQMKECAWCRIINCDSHDNFDYQLDKSGNLTQVDFGGNADGFADKQFSGGPNYYYGCRAWNNSDDGWDFYQRVTEGNVPTVIDNCICFYNGPDTYNMKDNPRYETDKKWFEQFTSAKEVTTKDGTKVTVTLENYPNMGNGNGFKLGGDKTKHNVMLHHCLSVGNAVKGFDQNNNSGKMYIYNCTAYDNAPDFGFNSAAGQLTIQNCITFASQKSNALKSTIVKNDHNSWNLSMTAKEADFESIDTTLVLSPRNADGSLKVIKTLRLSNASQFIDQGTDVGFDFTGNAPDLGCYENGIDFVEDDSIFNPAEQPDDIPLEPENKNGRKIAFITTPQSDADRAIITMLRERNDWSVWIVDADKNNDLSGFELIIISPVPKSSSVGAKAAKDAGKKMLVLKPFMIKDGVWNWGTPVNTSYASATIVEPTHDIFKNLSSSNEITFYNKVTTNGVVSVSAWALEGMKKLAITDKGEAISEGNNALFIGFSEYSSADISDDGLKLVANSIDYILNKTSSLAATHSLSDTYANKGVYDALGRFLGENTDNLPHGFYIINGTKQVR